MAKLWWVLSFWASQRCDGGCGNGTICSNATYLTGLCIEPKIREQVVKNG
jgi:hypothetical protein